MRPVSVFVGLRYLRARRSNSFASFVSIASVSGVALGVAALIVVLSVMNGFENELRDRLLSLSGHATFQSGPEPLPWRDILAELESAFRIHKKMGTILGGVHLELTGDHVTECTGGARGLNDEDLKTAYQTQVDPRLNYEQAMEVALRIADHDIANIGR